MRRAELANKAARAAPSFLSLGAWEPLFYSLAQPFTPPSTWGQGPQLKCVSAHLVPCVDVLKLPETTLPQTD